MKSLRIVWSDQAKASLKEIYDYLKPKSLQGAKNVKTDILEAANSVRFLEQYQVDDINPKFRRIVIRYYKLIYIIDGSIIVIIDIIDTRQSPEILKNK